MSKVEGVLIREPLTPSGAVNVSENTPVVQMVSTYGIPKKSEEFIVLDGTITTDDRGFVMSTGTTAFSFAVLRSRRPLIYRGVEGVRIEIAAMFSTGIANSTQRAGGFSVSDAVHFGYDGTSFGTLHSFDGAVEVQTLTLTVAASGAETATITLDGTGYSVSLTSGSLEHNAFEIMEDLNVQAVADWIFVQNGATVVAEANRAVDKTGAFTFSSTGTAAGAFVETNQGTAQTVNWTAQTNWSEGIFTGFDPTKTNVYVITYCNGYGNIQYWIQNPTTSFFDLVHTLPQNNVGTRALFENPSLNVGWVVGSFGSTTDLIVSGSEASLNIQGKNILTTTGESQGNIKSIATTETNILTIRNRTVFGGVQSKAELIPIEVTLSNTGIKEATFNIRINATIGGETDFTYQNFDESIAEFDTAGTTVAGGDLIYTAVVVVGEIISLVKIIDALEPNETITISGQFASGGANDLGATLIWKPNL